MKEKWPHLSKKIRAFSSRQFPSAVAKLDKLQYKMLLHPPYYHDLVHSDLVLFLNLKNWLCWRRLFSDSEINNATNAYFKKLQESYYFLLYKWKKALVSWKFSISSFWWIYTFKDVLNPIWHFLENVGLSTCAWYEFCGRSSSTTYEQNSMKFCT